MPSAADKKGDAYGNGNLDHHRCSSPDRGTGSRISDQSQKKRQEMYWLPGKRLQGMQLRLQPKNRIKNASCAETMSVQEALL